MSKLKGAEDVLSVEELLANSVVAFFDSMVKDTLTEPKSAEATRTMMRAFILALRTVAERSKDSQAMIDHMKANL